MVFFRNACRYFTGVYLISVLGFKKKKKTNMKTKHFFQFWDIRSKASRLTGEGTCLSAEGRKVLKAAAWRRW